MINLISHVSAMQIGHSFDLKLVRELENFPMVPSEDLKEVLDGHKQSSSRDLKIQAFD